MSAAPNGRDPGGRMPRNRARLLIVAAVVVILVVVFGYMLLVGGTVGD
ncbi:MAG TPA: hypothetical protein VK402_14475 [Blastococcus sp.]|nr:hypothetical protein [Blastococcus sp.]